MAGAGGIANGGVATLSFSQVDGNNAPGASGGGILNHGTMTLTNSQVNTNTANNDGNGDQGDGGGIANLNLDLVTMGITSPSGVLTIQGSSQVQNNQASGVGGGIASVGIATDGSPTAPAGHLTLKGVLITGNSAGVTGGGIFTVAGSPITASGNTINRNTPNNCFPPGSVPGCVG